MSKLHRYLMTGDSREVLEQYLGDRIMRPGLLQHPNIPKPLHGMNPRTILGQEWWDEKRQEAYAKYDYACWACEIHKDDADYHQWLEGHESYDIDYTTGSAALKEIVALCHSCHNFIHSGRMVMMVQDGTMEAEKMRHILERGLDILRENNLVPHAHTKRVYEMLTGKTIDDFLPEPDGPLASWDKWHLIIDGKKYYGKFKNRQEWQEHYQGDNKMPEMADYANSDMEDDGNAELLQDEIEMKEEGGKLAPVSQATEYNLQPSAQLVPDVRPSEVIARAQEQAKALMDIVEQQKLYHSIRDKKYLYVEAWQLLAAFNGLSIVVDKDSVQRIQKDDAEGWEASCEIFNREGQVVGAATAECLNSERNWKNRDDYMLRSMAQTRAVSKACRTILSFVVVLAGYEPTPYDEMSGVFDDDIKAGATTEQVDTILSMSTEKTIEWIRKTFRVSEVTELSGQQASALIQRLRKAKGDE